MFVRFLSVLPQAVIVHLLTDSLSLSLCVSVWLIPGIKLCALSLNHLSIYHVQKSSRISLVASSCRFESLEETVKEKTSSFTFCECDCGHFPLLFMLFWGSSTINISLFFLATEVTGYSADRKHWSVHKIKQIVVALQAYKRYQTHHLNKLQHQHFLSMYPSQTFM